jgi:hypothetical protein
LLEQPLQERGCLRPDRASPFLGTFSPKKNTARRIQPEVGRLQANDFAGPSTSVEHQAQQRQVSAAIVRINVDRLEHCLYFVKIQMFDYARNRAFERNA